MKKMIRQLIAAFLIVAGAVGANAQQITVKKVAFQVSDHTARTNPRLDNNGDTCALLRIKAGDLKGLAFPSKNQYIEAAYTDGEYHVYMPYILNKLNYAHESYERGAIDLKNDWGIRRLKPGGTYLVELDVPATAAQNGSIVFRLKPANATLSINGEVIPNEDGTGLYDMNAEPGNYTYEVSAPDYNTEKGSFAIAAGDAKPLAVNLKPVMVAVTISCNVDDANLYVDNVSYGRAESKMLPQGKHNVRISANKYLDYEGNVQIVDGMQPLSVELVKNTNRVDIHATDVTIETSSNRVYKNNKLIKEWSRSTRTVKMMPGTYWISDGYDHRKKVTVGEAAITVELY